MITSVVNIFDPSLDYKNGNFCQAADVNPGTLFYIDILLSQKIQEDLGKDHKVLIHKLFQKTTELKPN